MSIRRWLGWQRPSMKRLRAAWAAHGVYPEAHESAPAFARKIRRREFEASVQAAAEARDITARVPVAQALLGIERWEGESDEAYLERVRAELERTAS